MGVGNFQKWVQARYPSAFVDVTDTPVEHLYVDMSSLLHTVLRRSTTQDNFNTSLFTRLNFILSVCQPTKSVVLAMDGPAPLAKLLTQRARRKKDARASGAAAVIPGAKQRKERKSKRKKGLSKQGLTPGTPFIMDVQRALEFFICQKLASRRWQGVEFELLGCAVEGEGELKIIERMAARADDARERHAIVGGDSDLLLMALVAERPNLFVINDNQDIFGGATPFKADAPSASKAKHGLVAFSTDAIRQMWQRAPETRELAQTEEALSQLTLDFTTLSIVAGGNDYLSSVLDVRTLKASVNKSMWDSYLTYRAATGCGPLVTRSPAAHTGDGGEWGRWSSALEVDMPVLLAVLKASQGPSVFRPRASPNDFLPRRERAHVYLQGLAWCLNMYISGRCHDYRFVYHGTGPCIADFEQSLTAEGRLESEGGPSWPALLAPLDAIKARCGLPRQAPAGEVVVRPQLMPGRPLHPRVFALALMPASCYDMAPAPLRHLMRPGSPVADIFQECAACTRYNAQITESARTIAHLRQLHRDAEDALRAALEAESEEEESEEGEEEEEEQGEEERGGQREQGRLDEIETRLDGLIQIQRRVTMQRDAHVAAMHPYAPFPIGRLEQAVMSVPEHRFSTPHEKELLTFGHSYRFRSHTGRQQQRPAYWPPPPPVSKWDKLRLKPGLHIQREVVQRGGVCNPIVKKDTPRHRSAPVAPPATPPAIRRGSGTATRRSAAPRMDTASRVFWLC